MKKQTKEEQKLKNENVSLKDQIKKIEEIIKPNKETRKTLHLNKK